jgi:hypothetical protein
MCKNETQQEDNELLNCFYFEMNKANISLMIHAIKGNATQVMRCLESGADVNSVDQVLRLHCGQDSQSS